MVIRVTEEMVRMRDGASLACDVFCRSDAAGPVMLIRTPYGRAHDREEFDPVALARMGWVVVIQDVRGRFSSAGHFEPFLQEIDDGIDTVSWCRAQSWSNGKVATMGRSYVGFTALMAAAHSPVEACSPQLTAGDIRQGWMYENGILREGFARPWAAGFYGGEEDSDPFRKWADDSDKVYWDRISINDRIPKMPTAMFHVAGWFDIFCEGSLDLYRRMMESAQEGARVRQRLLVGPWTHIDLFGSQTDEVDFGLAANGLLAMTQLEIADWLLAAVSEGTVQAGAKVFSIGENRWREFESWPPESETLRLFLGEGGHLSRNAAGPVGQITFSHDPKDPVPTWGGRSLGPSLPWPGPKDQSVIEQRSDVLSFTSKPLEVDLSIAGEMKANIYVSSSAPTSDLILKLIDVHPDGRSMSVIDAGMRTETRAGSYTLFALSLGNIAMTFNAGHRIRLQIAGSNSPRLAVNPHAATHRIAVGGAQPSCVELPAI